MSDTKPENRAMRVWGLRAAGFAGGGGIGWLISNTDNFNLIRHASNIYNKVGITIVALMPLALWAVYAALRTGRKSDITLAYIGTTAQRVGLLGTVIGIVAATISIGDNLNTGAATAVTGALPAVGQALVSTAVGFVIAIVCDFFRYVNAGNEHQEI